MGPLFSRPGRWRDSTAAAAAALVRDFSARRQAYVPPLVSVLGAATSAGATSSRPAYRIVKLDYSSPGVFTSETPGRFIWFHEWSQIAGVYCYVQLNDASADQIIMRPGKSLTVPFERLVVTVPTLPGVRGELLVLPESPDALAQKER